MKGIKLKLIYLFILLQPFIDLVTALITRFSLFPFSLGIVIRGILVLLMLIYIFFINNSKYKKRTIFYLVLLGIFYFFYIVTKGELLTNFSLLYNEISSIFKYSYFIVLLLFIVNFMEEYKLDKEVIIKILLINLMIYSVFIIVPFLTKTGFRSYVNKEGYGSVGWFYSANEISAILTVLYPLLFISINKKITIKNLLMLFISLGAIIIIGTKAPYYSMLLITGFLVIYYLFNIKKNLPQFILVLVITFLMVIVRNNLPVNINLEQRNKCLDEYLQSGDTEAKIDNELECSVAEGQEIVILSGREALLKNVYKVYRDSNTVDKFLGIGFSNRQVLNSPKWSVKLIEMDLFDILFRFGIIGFILYMLVIFTIIKRICIYTFKNKFKLSFEQLIYGYTVAIGIGLSLFIGHVLGSPSSSFYLAILVYIALSLFKKEKEKLNREKVTILSLHLGVGGIEKAIVNIANSLCQSKEVQIICFYRLSKDSVYQIDDKVRVKYLYEGKPNKEELNKAFKTHNLLGIVKNAFLALSILWKRHFLMIREIKKIKEGIVISTRIEFSILLSEYGNDNVLKVAQEHRYHNHEEKYIKKMQHNYSNIDYLLALTETLKKDYEKFFSNMSLKVVLMPNMLESIPKEKSSLTNKKVVFVGRLEPVKRVNEIIDIAHELKDNDWQFNIVGDGKEKSKLEQQIKKLKLENKVFLLGPFPNDTVIDIIRDSSIFIMTSITEGLPMVLLEAMSVGVPVIAYETENGIKDIISNDKDGFIIKNRNKKDMVNKLTTLMNNDKLRKEMGDKCLIKAKKFSKEEITKKWLDFINNADFTK